MQIPTDESLATLSLDVAGRLLAAQRRLVTAESCTGGWIAKLCTDIAGSSDWFDCGFVCYSNAAKSRDLGVPEKLIETEGAVSDAVVRAMAEGALARAGANVAVAVSGIAGPGGAVPGKPVGTVWLAWAERSGHTGAELLQLGGDRAAVRAVTVRRALEQALALALMGAV
jgi:nicotinamide-nucleotide amidase